jgi:antitoxin (DNA-binding transcriptional repressor) of toxin-antitoxin stability system
MSKKEVGVEQARKILGDLADAAYHHGEITILTRYGRPYAAIVPTDLIPEEQTMSTTAYTANVGEDNAEWLAGRRGPSVGIENLGGGVVRIPSDAIPTLRERPEHLDGIVDERNGVLRIWIEGDGFALWQTYTLTIVEGTQPGSNGVDLGSPESPVQYGDLPKDVQTWLDENGFDAENPDIWVLVTPADEDPGAVNVIGSRDITI